VNAKRLTIVVVALALTWALLVVVTGYRLGWLTPVIGAVVGYAIRTHTRPAAALAVALTFAVIVLGRGCAAVGSRLHVSDRELQLEPSLVYDAVAARMYPADGPKDDPFNPNPSAFEKMARVQKEVAGMNDGEKRAAVAAYLGTTDVPVVRTHPAGRFFHWPDLLWWPAALLIAWRACAPRPVQRQLGLVETPVAEFERRQSER